MTGTGKWSSSLRYLALACAALALCGFSSATTTSDPDRAEIVTSDVEHFWKAFDDAAKVPMAQRASVYAKEYFDVGSPGLKDFVPDRLVSPESLAAHVEAKRADYAAIRTQSLQVVSEKAEIAADFRKLKAIYPDIKFPKHIYFVIGQQNSGGTNSDNGIILGVEIMAMHPEIVPFVAVHETIHFNQATQPEGKDATLLQNTVIEGTADFIASLVAEPKTHIAAARWQYGCAHEAELAARFAHDQGVTQMPPWIYSQPDNGWPSDMGYWLGYRIDQAFYHQAQDKTAALRSMLGVTDFEAYLKASGYPAKAPACAPEKPTV